MRKIKKPSRKIKKYEEAGQLDKLNLRLGSVTSAVNLAGDLKNTISNWGDSTKTQKAAGVFNSAGDAFGTMKSVPGLGMIAGIGEGVLKGVGAIAGMFPGKDGKAKAREEANQQVRLDRYNSGTLFSKHGGTLPPSSEYKIMPSAKSGRKAPITKLTEDMDIIGNDATFSHSSQDDIPTDTNNDGQEDLRMEGGEIILKNKDGQYMLNKKIAKPFSKKASILAKGDNISKNTLNHPKFGLKVKAIQENDANLASKGMFDRTSAFGGMITQGKGYANGDGDNIKKETVNLSPKNYQKLAKDKPVMTPQDFQKYLSDTGRINIKTYQVGPVDKGAQVREDGGEFDGDKKKKPAMPKRSDFATQEAFNDANRLWIKSLNGKSKVTTVGSKTHSGDSFGMNTLKVGLPVTVGSGLLGAAVAARYNHVNKPYPNAANPQLYQEKHADPLKTGLITAGVGASSYFLTKGLQKWLNNRPSKCAGGYCSHGEGGTLKERLYETVTRKTRNHFDEYTDKILEKGDYPAEYYLNSGPHSDFHKAVNTTFGPVKLQKDWNRKRLMREQMDEKEGYKRGGKIKKYDLAGNTGGPYRTDNPMVTEDYTPTSVPERKINPFVAPEEGYSPYFSAYKFPPGDNIQMNKIEPTAIPTNTSNTMYSVATPKISKAAKKGLPPMKIPSNPSNRERITGGEGIAGVGAMLGTGLKALALKRNKSLPFKLSDISSNLGESYSKALSGLDFGENEAIKDIQGKTNQALDFSSNPSYQSRLANSRNVLKGQASNIAQTRGHFSNLRANMRGQFASDLARQTSQNRTVENQVNQQEIDKRTQGWMDISQDLVNNSFNMGYLANARRYRDDLNRDYEWDGSTYRVKSRAESREKFGGKIKRPKKIK